MQNLLFLDFETTGVDLEQDSPIQIGAILTNDSGHTLDIIDKYIFPRQWGETLFSVEKGPNREAFKIHGITDTMIAEEALSLQYVASTLYESLNKYTEGCVTMVSDNPIFEWAMLTKLSKAYHAGELLKLFNYHALDMWTWAAAKGIVLPQKPHDAYKDALLLKELYFKDCP